MLSRLYLIEILHQTTTLRRQRNDWFGCILSKFYIKPQPGAGSPIHLGVVSYRNSTSNHNNFPASYEDPALYLIEILHQTTTGPIIGLAAEGLYLIEILHQTTTAPVDASEQEPLYLIEILHQTTTGDDYVLIGSQLYLIEILHQTTTNAIQFRVKISCILSKFYIKPQLGWQRPNFCCCCILSKFYIKPQLYTTSVKAAGSCILSKFYIKPQLMILLVLFLMVVSYRNSTSNHNLSVPYSPDLLLYLIEILHQTTTVRHVFDPRRCCILSKFYIKPQLLRRWRTKGRGCILSKFYIKPQQKQMMCFAASCCILSKFYIKPQQRLRHKIGHSCCILSKFYIKPQLRCVLQVLLCVVSYRNSTSNHNKPEEQA